MSLRVRSQPPSPFSNACLSIVTTILTCESALLANVWREDPVRMLSRTSEVLHVWEQVRREHVRLSTNPERGFLRFSVRNGSRNAWKLTARVRITCHRRPRDGSPQLRMHHYNIAFKVSRFTIRNLDSWFYDAIQLSV